MLLLSGLASIAKSRHVALRRENSFLQRYREWLKAVQRVDKLGCVVFRNLCSVLEETRRNRIAWGTDKEDDDKR
jgi:hypothetical protein